MTVKSFVNGGSLLPADLNSIEADYEYAFSVYRDMFWRGAALVPSTTSGTYMFYPGAGLLAVSATGTAGSSAARAGTESFYFDPADYTANTRTNKLRIRGVCLTNAVAPAMTMTLGLYPVATWGGSSGNFVTPATLGTVTSGSTVAFASPAVSTQTVSLSGDFTMPSAGHYVVAVSIPGTVPTSCYVNLQVQLQMRQV